MIKLGTIAFDDRILDALRDDNLAVFAGAGVSMGPPSNLASFWKLASDVAQGTGLPPAESEPLDRFLGQLQHRKVAVHERAAQLLSPTGSAPNALHHDLLRLFRTAERVRLVTTNFDLHFESAAHALFGSGLRTYRAPALPLGYDFAGIVHPPATTCRITRSSRGCGGRTWRKRGRDHRLRDAAAGVEGRQGSLNAPQGESL